MKKDHSIHKISRLLLIVPVVALLLVVWLPMWRIDLTAPQYPEGLKMLIYPNHLGGNVDIVNGLNHYIGMKAIRESDFPEFKILPGIFIMFSLLLALTALLNKRGMLQIVFILFLAFGIIAMYDFWKWEYNYGHNLNADAPIIVPGMAYQPPLIGFKQLLNFGAYSVPAIGGWLFAGAGVLLLAINIAEMYRLKKIKAAAKKTFITAIIILVAAFFSSCHQSVSPIIVGKDHCSFCKMPVSDARFGGEIITGKGRTYKFDDAHCLLSFWQSEDLKGAKNLSVYFVDFCGAHLLIPKANALFFRSEMFKSPMNGNIAAFDNADSLAAVSQKFSGVALDWDELKKQ